MYLKRRWTASRAAGESRSSRRASETWSPKSIDPFVGEQRLVAPVGAGELRLAARLLGERGRRVAIRVLGVRPTAVAACGAQPVRVGEVARRATTSSSFARENSVASASRNRVGSPSGRYSSSSSSNRRSRRKTTVSGRESTRTSVGRPSSRANSRISRSPKAWNVEIAVSV